MSPKKPQNNIKMPRFNLMWIFLLVIISLSYLLFQGNASDYGVYHKEVTYSAFKKYMESGYGHYMPEEMMEEMMDHYQAYNEASEEYERGNYGAEGGMAKSAEGIMKNITAIVEELSQADSPEVMEIIQKHAKKIMEIK